MRRIATALLLVVALAVTATFAYPSAYAKEKESDASDDAEYVVVPLSAQRPTYYNRYPSSFEGFDGVIDTADFAPVPVRPVYFPSYNPFSWHLSGYLDDILKRMRDRFAGSWNPFFSGIPSAGDFVPSGPGIWPADGIPDDSAEDGNTNSTSTVKVIDGHKVVINDTYYTKKTEFGTSIFKVRVIDVKPAGDDSASEPTEKPKETPTEVETGNRNGADDDVERKPAVPATEAPKRDTELESSDEEKTTADDNLNTIDSAGDIDGPKPKESEAPADGKPESSAQWSGLESFEAASRPLENLSASPEMAAQRNRDNSELLESSSEEETDDGPAQRPLSDEWPQPWMPDDRKRIIVSNRFDNRINANQQQSNPSPGVHDLSNDIAINFRLAMDKTVTANPNAIVFNPNDPPAVVVQQDPFPSPPGGPVFPGVGGRPTIGFPSQQPPGGAGFPRPAFPGFPGPFGGGQFPVQPFPMQTPIFGVPMGPQGAGTNFGVPQNPQVPPFFFANGPFGRP
ncbi:histone-lysine N-methyltransferase SETD1B isoform X2 [Anopheles bellator]|uniref:histone-lysine N-methyltransferase SETD1B isoform X2 n=1 Tax=Anopheles bellator TaxID=139047 RepID=UPI002649DA47|nr:histone-lysine N-methyltransferase SETD1B isoform X2 [Anopheles bellator]